MSTLIEMPPEGGWIYILMTSSDYTRVKIGMTINNPLLRLRDLKTGDPYLSLHVAYYIPSNLGLCLRNIEYLIHNHFNNIRIHFLDDEDQINKPSEWFNMNYGYAESCVDDVFKLEGYKITHANWCMNQAVEKAVIKHYDHELRYESCSFTLSLV
ncbi:GIY-YIG nuclease family protein [Photobacterium phosphoreum]|uniref:GIY-YIG nuclease family protein n=1 Tax=Photobacterium phosphoreum TaxID=659 RepID=UPI0039B016B1